MALLTEGPSPLALTRFVRGLTQTELAQRAGVSRETIGRLERGDVPRRLTARAIAEALGTTADALFPFNDERPEAATPGARETSAVGGRHDAD